MYKDYFRIDETPFSITPDPRYLFLTQGHQEALAHLLYGLSEGGGFVLLTGEVGTGKTSVCRCALDQVDDKVHCALILNPRLNEFELVAAICDELGVAYPDGTTSLKPLVDLLNRHLLELHAKGERAVVMLDEAQDLSPSVLEQVRLLTNLETDKQKLLQIILVGQPELNALLSRHEIRQLAQRITARYHLKPLKAPETRAYIHHRLRVAGLSQTLFTDRAISLVHKRARGVPRLINLVCDRAMLGAYVQERTVIDKAIVKRAAAEVLGRRSGVRPLRRPLIPWLATTATVAVAILVAVGYLEGASLSRLPERHAEPQATSLESQTASLGAASSVEIAPEDPPGGEAAADPGQPAETAAGQDLEVPPVEEPKGYSAMVGATPTEELAGLGLLDRPVAADDAMREEPASENQDGGPDLATDQADPAAPDDAEPSRPEGTASLASLQRTIEEIGEKPEAEVPTEPAEAPTAAAKTAPAETPMARVKTPKAPVEASTAPVEASTAPVETSKAPAETPTAPAKTPTAVAKASTAPADRPKTWAGWNSRLARMLAEVDLADNRESAMRQLFALWAHDYDPSLGGAACDPKKNGGFSCLEGEQGWSGIEYFDRPALIQLDRPDGGKVDAVLLSLQGDRAVVDVGGQALSVPKADVTSLWAGDYLLLWRPPRTWNGLLHEGSQGDAVLWLRTSLAQASGKPLEASENPLFDRALKKAVEEFQRLRAIEQDGVVGAQTMILLNNEIGGDTIPRLTTE